MMKRLIFLLLFIPCLASAQIRLDQTPELDSLLESDALYTAERGSVMKITLGVLRTWINSGGGAINGGGNGDDLGDHTATQNIDLGGNRLTNVDNAISDGDAPNLGQVDSLIEASAPIFWNYAGVAADTSTINRTGDVAIGGVVNSLSKVTVNDLPRGQLTGSSTAESLDGYGGSNEGNRYGFAIEEEETTITYRVKAVIDDLGSNTFLSVYAEIVGFSSVSLEVNGVEYTSNVVEDGEGELEENVVVAVGDSVVFVLGPTLPDADEWFIEGAFEFGAIPLEKPEAIRAFGSISALQPPRDGVLPNELSYNLERGIHLLSSYQSIIYSGANLGFPIDLNIVPKNSLAYVRQSPDWQQMNGSIFLPTSGAINYNNASIFSSIILGDFEANLATPGAQVSRSILVGSGDFQAGSIFNLQLGQNHTLDGRSTITVGDRNDGYCSECLIVGQQNEVGNYAGNRELEYTTVLGRQMVASEGDGGLYVGSWNEIEPIDGIRDNDPMLVVGTGSSSIGRRNILTLRYGGSLELPTYSDGILNAESGIVVSRQWQGEAFTASASQSTHTVSGNELPANEWRFTIVIDGLEKTNGVDYTYVAGTGVITFTPALAGGEFVKVRFLN